MVITMVANAALIKPSIAIGTEFTSVDALDGVTFAIINKADGKALYGSNAQNLAYDVYASAFSSSNSGYMWKLVSLANDADAEVHDYYRLQLITPDGKDYIFDNKGGWLNSQPTTGWCSFILGLNNQNGQDIKNGAVYDVQYEEGKGFSLKNIATGLYQGADAAPAKHEEPTYFTFATVSSTYVPAVVELLAEGATWKEVVTDADALAAYDAAIEGIDPENIEGDGLTEAKKVNAAIIALVKAQPATAGKDFTRAIVNPEINLADGWTIERSVNGNGPLLNSVSFEYWSYIEGKGGFDYWQEITGLPNGTYTITADMYNDQVAPSGNTFAAAAGVYGTSGTDTQMALVDVQGATFNTYTTPAVTVANGTLRIGIKNANADNTMPARWFVADNFKLTLVEPAAVAPTTYAVTIADGIENGTVVAAPTEAAEGETVTLTITPADGYELDELTVMNGETPVTVTENTFVMPAAAVTVSATFKEKAVEPETALIKNADFSESTPLDNHLCGYGKDMASNGTTYYGLQDVEGWNKVVVAGVKDDGGFENAGMGGGVFAYGSSWQMKGNNKTAPAAGPDGKEGQALGFFGVWGNGGYYYQDVTLPAGEYTLIVPIYNQSGTQANTTQTGFFVTGSDTKYTVAINTAVGKWTTQSVDFTLTEETAGQIRLGYVSTGGGSGANPMLYFDQVKLVSKLDGALELYDIALEDANKAAQSTIVTGEEMTTLNEVIAANANIDKTSLEAVEAATKALNDAVSAFNAIKPAYQQLADTKALVEIDAWPYASASKKAAVEEAMDATATSADDATAKATVLIKAYRQFVESNAIAEGVEGAVVMTDKITNPAATDGTNNWTTKLGEGSGGSIGVKVGTETKEEPWTDSEDNVTHNYFDGGNWGAQSWDVSLEQEITLEPGKYMLTAIARASGDVAFSLYAGETKVTIPAIGASGGVFNRGWNDQFVEFEVEEAGAVKIGVQGVTDKQHNWMSFSNFRLVQFPATYAIAIADGIEGGKVEADVKEAEAGATVTLTITPNEGYELTALSVKAGEDDVEVAEGYTFVMPAAAVTINATFAAVAPELFKWAYNFEEANEGTSIVGAGTIVEDETPGFGKVYENVGGAIRTNYLLLPEDLFAHSAGTKELSISFWVNANGKDANTYTYAPFFAAYGAAPNPANTWPMLILQSRGTAQVNCSGWTDFAGTENADGKNNIYNSNSWEANDAAFNFVENWLDDGKWHFFTANYSETGLTIYMDGVVKNQWTCDGTDGKNLNGLFSNGADLKYICLGGNQAWDWSDGDSPFRFDDVMVTNYTLSLEAIKTIIADKIPVIVLNAPTFNAEEGTQAEPNMLPEGSTLKINYTADNLAEYGLTADDVKVKVTVMVSGDLPENERNMASETKHSVRGETFYIPLGETDFPVALKPGYVYQNVAVMAAELVKPATDTEEEETLAAYGDPVQLHWVGIYDDLLIEIAQDQGKSLDEFPRTEFVEGDDYNTYTCTEGIQVAFKMFDIDVKDCDYVIVKFAEPVAAGWELAFWAHNDQSTVAVPAGATEYKYVFADDTKCAIQNGILPQICMLRLWSGTPPLEAKVTGVYKHYLGNEVAQEINVERYPGMGYTATEATVDFALAKRFLGVKEVTNDMLRIVNPDNTETSDYAPYDGWFNAEGVAEAWNASTTKVCAKFFQAIPNGTFEICDMNGADEVGKTYSVKWALVANDKKVVYTINVTFVEKPAIALTFDDLNVVDEKAADFSFKLGTSYQGEKATVDVAAILDKLEVESLSDVTIYAVQSDGSLDDNYKLGTTDGWRNAAGDWQGWGADAFFYVKANFAATENQLYDVGTMDPTQNTTIEAGTFTAKYAFVKGNDTHDAVVLSVNVALVDPVGINSIEIAKAKGNGKYLDKKGHIIIVNDNKAFSLNGIETE